MSGIIKNILYHLPDKAFLTIKYLYRCKHIINWNNPKRYNEKIQWLKLYYHRPDLVDYVDKEKVKNIIAQKIGTEHIIPTIGVWNDPKDIDFSTLPKQFVLKCTHDSGSVVICKDKTKLDKEKTILKLEEALKTDSFLDGREWPYKMVHPKVIAEQYMEDTVDQELRDYKFFVFDGIARWMFIATDRLTANVDTCFDFYDMDFNHIDVRHGHPNSKKTIGKPSSFEEMKTMAEIIGKDFPHARVDFYQVNGKVYFGEITFYHHCGFMPFDPDKWDFIFGEAIKLPDKIQ